MRRKLCATLACYLLTSTFHAAHAAEEVATLSAICDQAAASPLDPTRPPNVAGVEGAKLIAQVAVPACEAALKQAPVDPRIAYQLGRAYGVAHNYSAAVAMFEKADSGGHPIASNDLAVLLADGIGVPKDVPRAMVLFEKAANSGVALGARNLGKRYASGNGVPQDYVKARFWFGEGVKSSDNLSREGLAFLLSKGLGGSKDLIQSQDLYMEAAESGSIHAAYMLGMLIVGNLGPENEDSGVHWLQRAASAGNGSAMMALGTLNEYGSKRRAKNLGAARQYYEQASNVNADGARQALERLNGQPVRKNADH